MNLPQTSDSWVTLGTAVELLAQSFTYPTNELAETLTSGEYAKTAQGIIVAYDLGNDNVVVSALKRLVDSYEKGDAQTILQALRVEHTRLFIGTRQPIVSPYGSFWKAVREGKEPVYFLSKETADVEAIMHAAGVGNKNGSKEPLDYIGCELEFLHYACLVMGEAEPRREGVRLDETVLDGFLQDHVRPWIGDFCAAVEENSENPFFLFAASLLKAVFDTLA